MSFWTSPKVEVHPKAVVLAVLFTVTNIFLAAQLDSFIGPLILFAVEFLALIPMNRAMIRTDPRLRPPQSPPQ